MWVAYITYKIVYISHLLFLLVILAKNVAAEIAKKVCENVAQNLEGKQLGSFQFVTSIVKQALNDSMVQILTPKKRIDILRDVYEAQRQKRPYVIVFCGVNGVGKSTNLAKVTFWLIENSFRGLFEFWNSDLKFDGYWRNFYSNHKF